MTRQVFPQKAWRASPLVLSIAVIAALAGAGFVQPSVGAEFAVYKSPWCGCCSGWVEMMQASGHTVIVNDMENLDIIKNLAGVPEELQACHTAVVAGYIIEGHVPVADIERFLAERVEARGLAVPGMPMGAPGMGGGEEPFDVLLFSADGAISIYAQY